VGKKKKFDLVREEKDFESSFFEGIKPRVRVVIR